MHALLAHARTIEKRRWSVTLVGLLLALGVVSLPFSTWRRPPAFSSGRV